MHSVRGIEIGRSCWIGPDTQIYHTQKLIGFEWFLSHDFVLEISIFFWAFGSGEFLSILSISLKIFWVPHKPKSIEVGFDISIKFESKQEPPKEMSIWGSYFTFRKGEAPLLHWTSIFSRRQIWSEDSSAQNLDIFNLKAFQRNVSLLF